MKVIVLAGKAGSGKNYLGEKLVYYAQKNHLRAVLTEYSKYLKLYAKELLNYDAQKDEKPRKFLQDIGSFVREKIDASFLVKRMLDDFYVYETCCDVVVISDARLIQEIEALKQSAYEVISIKVVQSLFDSNLSLDEKKHVTELELDDYQNFDYIIENKSKEEIELFARNFFERRE